MGCRRNWASWLTLAVSVFCAAAQPATAQEKTSLRRTGPTRLPYEKLPADARAKVRQVIERPTVTGHGAAEVFAGDPSLYQWLLEHPDRGVIAWRRLGARCSEITDRGNGVFGWADDNGSDVSWRSVLEDDGLRVWLAEGKVRPGPLLPMVTVHAVLVLKHHERPDGPDRTLIFHQADGYLKVESHTAALVTRMLGSSGPRLAEQGLGQIELFFSGLVWYLEQHPDRSDKLFAEKQPGETLDTRAPKLKLTGSP